MTLLPFVAAFLVIGLALVLRRAIQRRTLLGSWEAILARQPAAAKRRDLESLDRMLLTPQHSLHHLRCGERRYFVVLHPNGCTVVDQVPLTAASSEPAGLIRCEVSA